MELFNKKIGRILESYSEISSKIMENNDVLSNDELDKLRELSIQLGGMRDIVSELLWKIGSLIDYDNLKREGFKCEELIDFQCQDNASVDYAQQHLIRNIESRNHMFGFPANMEKPSATTSYLKTLEMRCYLMNG